MLHAPRSSACGGQSAVLRRKKEGTATATYGYIRVSTREQRDDRQRLALLEQGVAMGNIYTDKQSGKNFDRPQYRQLLSRLRREDLLLVKSIDRLGRNYREVQEQWRHLTLDLGVEIAVLDMPLLDTRRGKDLLGTFVSDLVLQVLSFVAENERENIRLRQAEGIEAARARGVRFGRPRRPLPEAFPQVRALWRAGELSLDKAAAACGLPRSTFYARAKEAEREEG